MRAIENHAYLIGEVVLVDASLNGAPYKLGIVVHRTPKTLRVEIPDPNDPDAITTHEFSKSNAAMHVHRVTFEERKLASWLFVVHRNLLDQANALDPGHKGGNEVAAALRRAAENLGDAHVWIVGHPIYASASDEATRRWWPIVHYFDKRPHLKRAEV